MENNFEEQLLSNPKIFKDHNLKVLTPRKDLGRSWDVVIEEALENPLSGLPLEQQNLLGKKVCLIVDDWGRPTPVSLFIHHITDRLLKAGMNETDLTILTASGMHSPMSKEDLERKLGANALRCFSCHSHNAGDLSELGFAGVTPLGTPVWASRFALEADFTIAAGRVYPHACHGYEGGYKMICPGISSFETIVRNHSLNFSERSRYGVLPNSSRDETDAIGRVVGIDFLINFTVDSKDKPVKAFSGHPDEVFRTCVNFGEKEVWYRKQTKYYDIVLVEGGTGFEERLSNNPSSHLRWGFEICKPQGTVIARIKPKNRKVPVIDGINLETLSLPELMLLHEKRNWNCTDREVQERIKAIRSMYYEKRELERKDRNFIIIGDHYDQAALRRMGAKLYPNMKPALIDAIQNKKDLDILVIPDATSLNPIRHYSFPEES